MICGPLFRLISKSKKRLSENLFGHKPPLADPKTAQRCSKTGLLLVFRTQSYELHPPMLLVVFVELLMPNPELVFALEPEHLVHQKAFAERKDFGRSSQNEMQMYDSNHEIDSGY